MPFKVKLQRQSDLLDAWLNVGDDGVQEPTERLRALSTNLIDHVHSWNEAELRIKFIGPLLSLVNFDQEAYQSFFERVLSAPYQNDTISGDVDFFGGKGDACAGTALFLPT